MVMVHGLLLRKLNFHCSQIMRYWCQNCKKADQNPLNCFVLKVGAQSFLISSFCVYACKLYWTIFSPDLVKPLYGARTNISQGWNCIFFTQTLVTGTVRLTPVADINLHLTQLRQQFLYVS